MPNLDLDSYYPITHTLLSASGPFQSPPPISGTSYLSTFTHDFPAATFRCSYLDLII